MKKETKDKTDRCKVKICIVCSPYWNSLWWKRFVYLFWA